MPSQISAVLLIPLAILALFATGCQRSSAPVAQSAATGGDQRWDGDIRQLPWREPSLGDHHVSRSGATTYLPGRPPNRTHHRQETHIDQRTRAGRRALPHNDSIKH
ncbi:MAG: hypothetical protein EA402_02005 [Planctomycetota bacterium]|nr:MAG: hypothetical protein EA402_02005 [Planctomycetota bacterium]